MTLPGAPSREQASLVDGTKLIRLESMLQAVLAESRAVGLDSVDTTGLSVGLESFLVEVGSCLSEPLLDELSDLVGPLRKGQVDRDTFRVILAQLEGWVRAVVAEALMAVETGQVASSDPSSP